MRVIGRTYSSHPPEADVVLLIPDLVLDDRVVVTIGATTLKSALACSDSS